MLLNKQEKRYKKYICLIDEWNDLMKQERNLPWVEVEKPYQDGWTLQIDFRDDIKNRSDYPELKEALELIERSGRIKDQKLIRRIRSNKKLDAVYKLFASLNKKFNPQNGEYWLYGKGNYSCWLGQLKESAYDNIKNPLVQKWFCRSEEIKHGTKIISYYLDVPRYWLIVKIKPAIVTHVKNIDPLLRQRMAEIDKELDLLRELGAAPHYYSYKRFYKHWQNSALRCFERAAIQKFIKGEAEDFEIKKAIKD